jgi:hypothetical protein
MRNGAATTSLPSMHSFATMDIALKSTLHFILRYYVRRSCGTPSSSVPVPSKKVVVTEDFRRSSVC